jgi:hypothetical protein
LVDVPDDDVVYVSLFRSHLLPRSLDIRQWAASMGTAVAGVGSPELLCIADTQRAICARGNPEGRVRGEKGRDPLRWIALGRANLGGVFSTIRLIAVRSQCSSAVGRG